eukprot:12917755-Prorocentrum_lima.AAC.1
MKWAGGPLQLRKPDAAKAQERSKEGSFMVHSQQTVGNANEYQQTVRHKNSPIDQGTPYHMA